MSAYLAWTYWIRKLRWEVEIQAQDQEELCRKLHVTCRLPNFASYQQLAPTLTAACFIAIVQRAANRCTTLALACCGPELQSCPGRS